MDTTRRFATEARPARRRVARRLAAPLLALAGLSAALILPASTFAATTTVPTTDGSSSACAGGAWPASVQGAQAVAAGTAAGDHLWHDATGWHLRVTHVGTTRAIYTGSIHANRPLNVHGYRLESGDTFTLSADHLTVTYRFANYGKVDGLDFTTDCATRLGVGGRLNGALLPVRRIWLGRTMRHPLQNPFVILRNA
jgi:hypothetical protein